MSIFNKWLTYTINGKVRKAKIVAVEQHPVWQEDIFRLVSPYGNEFRFTLRELLDAGAKFVEEEVKMTNKYVMKPVEVEAVRWNGDNFDEVKELNVGVALYDLKNNVPVGSYIVKGMNGKPHLFSNEAFHATYERKLVWDENI